MSKHLIAAPILAVMLTAATTTVEAHYTYAAYPYDCTEYHPNCVLYDYPHSTYYYSGHSYPYWGGGWYWGGRRHWGDGYWR